MEIIWWGIVFSDGSTGYMKMNAGYCMGVFRADGTVVRPEEKVEYTCVNMDVAAPSWA